MHWLIAILTHPRLFFPVRSALKLFRAVAIICLLLIALASLQQFTPLTVQLLYLITTVILLLYLVFHIYHSALLFYHHRRLRLYTTAYWYRSYPRMLIARLGQSALILTAIIALLTVEATIAPLG